MKKVLLGLLLFFIIACVVLLAAKDHIARIVLIKGIRQACGLEASVKQVHLGLVPASLEVQGLKIYNPEGYADALLADAPELYVAYEPFSLFKKEAHIKELRVTIKEFLIAQNKERQYNVGSWGAQAPGFIKAASARRVAVPSHAATGRPGIKATIDLFTLQIGRIVYKDYSGFGDPKVIELNLHMNQTFEHVTDPGKTVAQIFSKFSESAAALSQLTAGRPKPAQEQITPGVLQGEDSAHGIVDAVKDTVESAAGDARDVRAPY